MNDIQVMVLWLVLCTALLSYSGTGTDSSSDDLSRGKLMQASHQSYGVICGGAVGYSKNVLQ